MRHLTLANACRYVLQLAFLALLLGAVWPVAASGSYERFFIAIQRDDVGTIERLRQLGFDLNSPNPDLQHPLLLAVGGDAVRVARFLLAQPEVDVNARNQVGENALMLAALRGHLDLVQALLARRAEVNQPGGWAALHYAASHDGPNALAITRLLLQQHAFIDAESPNRTTPLMMAAKYGPAEVVHLLLQEGADPRLRNQQGLSAIDFARMAEREHVAETIATFIRRSHTTGAW